MSRELALDRALREAVTYLNGLGGEHVVIAERLSGVLREQDVRAIKCDPVVVDDVIYGADSQVAVAVCDMLGADIVDTPFKGIGIIDGSKIVGGALYFNHLPGKDIEAAIAVADHSKITRGTARRLLNYPFEELRLPRLSMQIDMDNQRAIKVAAGYGARHEGTKRGANIGIFGLLPSECAIWRAAA